MVFGSDEFFEKLKIGMASGAGDEFYSEVLEVVKDDVLPRIERKVSAQDSEDVLQQVLISVWVSLAKYVMSSEELSPAQRNAWLLRITDNKIADHYRSLYADRENTVDDMTLLNLVSDQDSLPELVLERNESLDEQKNRLDQTVRYISSMKIAPEKLIAFFYSKVIFFLEAGGVLKGSAKYASEKLNGKTLEEIWPHFLLDFERALGRPLPADIVQSLKGRIAETAPNAIVAVEIDAISDSTTYIVKRVRATQENEPNLR